MDSPVVRGQSRVVALFGDPVAHSLSPLIHNHAFSRLGLPFVYIPVRVASDAVHTAAQALRAFSFAGANVTIPHKKAFIPYCDRISDVSRRLGVVNTLYFEKGLLCGTTTDPQGFLGALRWMRHDPAEGSVMILGNGGTARTIALTLAGLNRPPRQVTIVGRDPAKSLALATDVAALASCAVRSAGLNESIDELLCACTLLINATPVGMSPAVDRSPLPPHAFHNGMTVFDTIYNPTQTLFLSYAEKAGCQTQNGLRMLLYQALASFEVWTGQKAPEEMFDLAELESCIGVVKG